MYTVPDSAFNPLVFEYFISICKQNASGYKLVAKLVFSKFKSVSQLGISHNHSITQQVDCV